MILRPWRITSCGSHGIQMLHQFEILFPVTMTAWLRFDTVRRGLAMAKPRQVLEIGAGEGALGAWLAERFDYIGVEPDDVRRALGRACREELVMDPWQLSNGRAGEL